VKNDYSIKIRLWKLREEVESEFLSINMDRQKLLKLSMDLDALILMYLEDEKVNSITSDFGL